MKTMSCPWLRLVSLCCVLLILALFGLNRIRIRNPWVQEYLPGTGNIKGHVDAADYLERGEAFAIGADENGYAVFKHPYRALDALSRKYRKTLWKIRLQNLLPRLDYGNFRLYWRHTDHPAWATTEAEREDTVFLLRFFDIYENSFK